MGDEHGADMKEPDKAGDVSIAEGGDSQTPEHKRPAFSFVAKGRVKKQQKKKVGIKIRTVKPWSPVAFKDGKKRNRNSNLLLLSPIPEKREARKKIHFDDNRNEHAGSSVGDGEAKNSSMPGETQPQRAVVEGVNEEQDLQIASPPENTPAIHSAREKETDKGLQIPSNGNLGELEHSLHLVTPSSQLNIFGKNTNSPFVKYGGSTLDLANKATCSKEGNIRSIKDQVAVLSLANDEILNMVVAQPLQHVLPPEEGRKSWVKGDQNWNTEGSKS